MKRTRSIAGTPVRSATEAWNVIKELLADTLERSAEISEGSVGFALLPLDGLAPSLVASGALAETPIELIAGKLHIEIYVIRGDRAFEVDENLSPVPGGASAPNTWKLYVSPPAHLVDLITSATEDNEHLQVGSPPAGQTSAQASSTSPKLRINESALRRLGGVN